MTDIDWPFAEDGVKRDEFAESLRLPIIRSPHPRWCYVTAVMVGEYPWDKVSVRPTDDELRAIASFHQEYLNHWYNPHWITRMAEKPFDLDGGANMVIFIKRPDGGFAYRRGSWDRGPEFVPDRDAEPMGLVQVMDRIHTIGDGEPMQRWIDWKAGRAEVFAAATHTHTDDCMCVMVPMEVEGARECHYCGGHTGGPCGDRCDIARAEVTAHG